MTILCVCLVMILMQCQTQPSSLFGSTAVFNHAGDGIILTHNNQHTIRVYEFPALKVCATTVLSLNNDVNDICGRLLSQPRLTSLVVAPRLWTRGGITLYLGVMIPSLTSSILASGYA